MAAVTRVRLSAVTETQRLSGLERYNRDDGRTDPAILRANAIAMDSSAGSGVGVDP